MLWHIQIEPAPGHADRIGDRLALEAVESGLSGPWAIRACRGFLIEGAISEADLERAARDVLVDPVVEVHTIRKSRAEWVGSREAQKSVARANLVAEIKAMLPTPGKGRS